MGTAQGGRAQSPWATSRRQPTPARPPHLEAGGMGLSPGPATSYLGGSLLSLNLLILKKDMKRHEKGGGGWGRGGGGKAGERMRSAVS